MLIQGVSKEMSLKIVDHSCYFQQDGAYDCSAQSTMALLNEFLKVHLISEDQWPARSPGALSLKNAINANALILNLAWYR